MAREGCDFVPAVPGDVGLGAVPGVVSVTLSQLCQGMWGSEPCQALLVPPWHWDGPWQFPAPVWGHLSLSPLSALPGLSVGLLGLQAAGPAMPRAVPGSALGALEPPRGTTSRAGCSCCHLRELPRLLFPPGTSPKASAAAGNSWGLSLLGCAFPWTLLSPPGESQHTCRECCTLIFFCPVFNHSACLQWLGRIRTLGKGTSPISRCCWIPISPFPVGSGSLGLELCCHFLPGARE